MKKICFYIFAVVFFSSFARTEVLGCSCVPRSPDEPLKTQVAKAKAESKAVFTGTVTDVIKNTKNEYVIVKLKLLKAFKGTLSKVVTIYTGWNDADCGYNFKVGTTYLVYTYKASYYSKSRNIFETNICTRTTKEAEAKTELEILGTQKSLPKDKSKKIWP